MSTTYIGAALRRQVVARANGICEYCLIHQDDTYLGCHIDHVISEKHGGLTVEGNLAYACTFCNLHKGSDLGSLSAAGALTRFYNPRADIWAEHFALVGATIEPLTEIGEVTARIFGFNNGDQRLEREALIGTERYPSDAASRQIRG